MALFPKLDLIALLVDSSFVSAIYMHGVFSSISFRGVNNDLVLPTRDTPIFKGRSGDYGPKSVRGRQMKPRRNWVAGESSHRLWKEVIRFLATNPWTHERPDIFWGDNGIVFPKIASCTPRTHVFHKHSGFHPIIAKRSCSPAYLLLNYFVDKTRAF